MIETANFGVGFCRHRQPKHMAVQNLRNPRIYEIMVCVKQQYRQFSGQSSKRNLVFVLTLVKALVWAAIIPQCCLWLFDFFIYVLPLCLVNKVEYIIAKLTYAASAWRGFTKASDRQRIDALLRRYKRCGSLPDHDNYLSDCNFMKIFIHHKW